MESWQFIQSPAGDWYWLCSNVISRQTRTSTATFKTRTECVANAMTSGYQKVVGAAASGGGAPPQVKSQSRPGNSAQPAKRPQQRRNRNRSGKRGKSNSN